MQRGFATKEGTPKQLGLRHHRRSLRTGPAQRRPAEVRKCRLGTGWSPPTPLPQSRSLEQSRWQQPVQPPAYNNLFNSCSLQNHNAFFPTNR